MSGAGCQAPDDRVPCANGSPMELETHLFIANRLSYIGEAQLQSILDNAAELGRMLAGLIGKLKAQRESPDTWHLTPDTCSAGG